MPQFRVRYTNGTSRIIEATNMQDARIKARMGHQARSGVLSVQRNIEFSVQHGGRGVDSAPTLEDAREIARAYKEQHARKGNNEPWTIVRYTNGTKDKTYNV